jgi:hypothetical protein
VQTLWNFHKTSTGKHNITKKKISLGAESTSHNGGSSSSITNLYNAGRKKKTSVGKTKQKTLSGRHQQAWWKRSSAEDHNVGGLGRLFRQKQTGMTSFFPNETPYQEFISNTLLTYKIWREREKPVTVNCCPKSAIKQNEKTMTNWITHFRTNIGFFI